MDRFQALNAFREVASCGGFAAAARSSGNSPATVSRLISELEEDLGVRLFNRTTRNVVLTEEGKDLLERGMILLDEFEAVATEIRERKTAPRGLLRISSAQTFGQAKLAPLIPEFLQKYQHVSVELETTNRKVDLVQEHFDLVFRIGGQDGLEESSLKARRVFTQRQIFVASPEYVDWMGAPTELADLSDHLIAKPVAGKWGRTFLLQHPKGESTLTISERFVLDSPAAALNSVLAGKAIGFVADYLAHDFLTSGKLIRLLPDHATAHDTIFAVFVHRNYVSAKIRAFIDFVIDELNPS